MKRSRSMLLWGILLSSTAVFSTMPFVPAQDEGDRTTASEVVDRETLKKFVESARDHILSLADVNQWAAFAAEMREEGGDWRDGNMYLVILTPSGTVWRHGTDAKLEGIDVSDVMDDDGAAVVQKILTAGQMEGGGFVEYTWDDPSDPDDTNPKVCYVVQYASPLNQRDLLLVGGYYQDISEVSTDIGEFPDPPAVTAGDVVDRETLKAFVRGTIAWALEGFATFGLELNQLLDEARREGGPWKMGSTYLYALTEEGFVIMHAARPDQQGQIQIDREDRNGFKFVKALIDAANSGGGYVEYYWDDPLVIGDEDLGSAKIGLRRADARLAGRRRLRILQGKPDGSGFRPFRQRGFLQLRRGVGQPGRHADPTSRLFLWQGRRPHRSGIDGGCQGESGNHGFRRSHPPVRIAVPGRNHHFDERYGRLHDRIGEGGYGRPRQPHRRSASL